MNRRHSFGATKSGKGILVLARMGVSMPQVEIGVHILLVAFQAMKRSRHRWDLLTMDLQEACMERLTARMRFNEGFLPNSPPRR